MNNPHPAPSSPSAPRHRVSRAETQRRRQRTVRRVAAFTALLMILAAGTAFAASRLLAAPPASAASIPASGTAAPKASEPVQMPSSEPEINAADPNALTPAQAAALLADPRMVLVNHHTPMPEDYTFDTKECGSQTAINKTLQTEAADAFLQMQQAAADDGVTVWMQSGYRSVSYQATLYKNKTQQYLDKGYDEATAKEKAAAIVNPPGYSEHNCGLAADLNSPEHTALDEGFEDTAAFRWLCEHAEAYGFILRYPKGEEAVAITEITYEPWHWRYVGPENAARINASGLCFEQYIEMLQQLAAQQG